jgi:hypothetical protein
LVVCAAGGRRGAARRFVRSSRPVTRNAAVTEGRTALRLRVALNAPPRLRPPGTRAIARKRRSAA